MAKLERFLQDTEEKKKNEKQENMYKNNPISGKNKQKLQIHAVM